ncbi:serine/threonine protein phosphatase [Aliidongia dinghuensis]|uniref:Serine/threonine protein phosphatase n=2 Tax=Aliidongia dinghuensis TaxID=1867774 RepID=A0A8J3E5D8_9PROT|nr:serine/threonine protein phosphatase [Aliidongia dinghuensis]
MTPSIRAWSATHPGAVRTQNQDACLCRPEIGLFAVADGVGGHNGGEIAAARVMEMLSLIPDGLAPAARLAAVRAGLQDTHRALLDMARQPGSHIAPATTIVALLLDGDHFACLWAGDSRAYLLRDGVLHRLTTDHSVVQSLVSAGALTEAEAEQDPRQNVITRAVGAGPEALSIAKSIGEVQPDDRFLLCSDGLYKTLEVEEIARTAMGDAADVAQQLITRALAQTARDNVTVVVAAPQAAYR